MPGWGYILRNEEVSILNGLPEDDRLFLGAILVVKC